MQLLRRAENLTEVRGLLDPGRPLEGKWLACFYADLLVVLGQQMFQAACCSCLGPVLQLHRREA